MFHWKKYGLQGVAGLVFLASLLLLGLSERTAWPTILLFYALAFSIYVIVIRVVACRFYFWLVMALCGRVLMLFTFPNLSDDIYRFIWDGQLWLHGLNPYQSVPLEIVRANIDAAAFSQSLYAHLNSPDYYTVYPAFPQLTFIFAAWIAGHDWFWNAFVMKVFLLVAECFTLRYMYLLLKRRGRERQVLLYALNPLVIVELTGNVHFEAFMIVGLVAAYYYLVRGKVVGAAGALILGVGSKLLPVLALPLLMRRMSFMRLLMLTSVVLAGCVLIILPVFAGGAGFMESIGLYFRTFEFNASIYYVARFIGYQLEGYNTIATTGPWLMAAALLCMSIFILAERKPTIQNWPLGVLIMLSIYLAFTTTVHPWYICPLVAMTVFTRWRYAVVWSGAVFLSYATYRTEAYTENLWLVAVEYAVVGSAVVVDLWRHTTRSPGQMPSSRK